MATQIPKVSLGDRLWVPHQAMREFWRNRITVLGGRSAATRQAVSALEKALRSGVDALTIWRKQVAAAEAAVVDLQATAQDKITKIIGQMQVLAPVEAEVASPAGTDAVVSELERLLLGRVGAAMSEEAWAAAVAEGRRRVAAKEPPGFRDAEKGELDVPEGPAGDYPSTWPGEPNRRVASRRRSSGSFPLVRGGAGATGCARASRRRASRSASRPFRA